MQIAQGQSVYQCVMGISAMSRNRISKTGGQFFPLVLFWLHPPGQAQPITPPRTPALPSLNQPVQKPLSSGAGQTGVAIPTEESRTQPTCQVTDSLPVAWLTGAGDGPTKSHALSRAVKPTTTPVISGEALGAARWQRGVTPRETKSAVPERSVGIHAVPA
jgi:hypothetical protein